jgi:DNA-binding IclR family transcriptional regulator
MPKPETVSSAKKTLATLEAVVESDRPVGVSDVAETVGLTNSTAYKHLATLVQCGYVDRVGDKYGLSIRGADLGEHAKFGDELCNRALSHVDTLVQTTDESAGLVVKDGAVAVDIYHRTNARSQSNLNSRYLHASAPGKAILATITEAEVESIVDETGLISLTENTISSRERLHEELATARERGFAFDRREQQANIHAVAVPVKTSNRVGALYVAGDAERLSSKRLEEDVPGVILGTVRRLREELEAE